MYPDPNVNKNSTKQSDGDNKSKQYIDNVLMLTFMGYFKQTNYTINDQAVSGDIDASSQCPMFIWSANECDGL